MEQEIFGITLDQLLLAGVQTVYMLGWGMLIGTVIGIGLALALVLSRRGGLMENRVTYAAVNVSINIVRSIPFIILLVAMMPITRAIVGTSEIGRASCRVSETIRVWPVSVK